MTDHSASTGTEEPAVEKSSYSGRANRSAIGVIALSALIALSIKILFVLSASPNIRGVEQNVLFTIQELMNGDSLYPDPTAAPFSITQYSPLYYIVVAGASSLLGLDSATEVAQIYVIGRGISVLASIGITLFAYATMVRLGVPRVSAVVGSVVTLVVPIPWYSLLRPDALAALLGLASVFLISLHFERRPESNRCLLPLACGSLGFLAVLTKQNSAAFFAAICAFLLARRFWRELLHVVIGAAATLAITSAAFYGLYRALPGHGNHFYSHIVGGLDNGTDWALAYQKLYSIYASWYMPLLVLPIVGLLVLVSSDQHREILRGSPAVGLIATCFAMVTIFNLVAGLKLGSAVHYMNESMILGVMLVTMFLQPGYPFADIRSSDALRRSGVFTVAAFLLLVVAHQSISYRSFLFVRDSFVQVALVGEGFESNDAVRESPLLYTTDRSIMGALHQRVIFPQPDLAGIAHSRGVFDFSNVANLIETQQLRIVLVRSGQQPPTHIYGIEIGPLQLVASENGIDAYEIRSSGEN